MRILLFALFALTFTVLGGVGATIMLAKPARPRSSSRWRAHSALAPFPIRGTVTVESIVEQDGQLAVRGTATPADETLFGPLAVTIYAYTVAFEDAAGSTVDINTTDYFLAAGKVPESI